MTDELIYILNDDLSFLKTTLKSKVHKHGYLHASVHVWFYTDAGEVLLQKRSPTKIAFPNLWDVSVAGHISSGGIPITSAIREIEREIGLVCSENELKHIGQFNEIHHHKDDFIDNEIHYIYLCKLSKPINQLKIQEEELSAIKLMPVITFIHELTKNNFTKTYVPHLQEYYSFVLKKLNKYLT